MQEHRQAKLGGFIASLAAMDELIDFAVLDRKLHANTDALQADSTGEGDGGERGRRPDLEVAAEPGNTGARLLADRGYDAQV